MKIEKIEFSQSGGKITAITEESQMKFTVPLREREVAELYGAMDRALKRIERKMDHKHEEGQKGI